MTLQVAGKGNRRYPLRLLPLCRSCELRFNRHGIRECVSAVFCLSSR